MAHPRFLVPESLPLGVPAEQKPHGRRQHIQGKGSLLAAGKSAWRAGVLALAGVLRY